MVKNDDRWWTDHFDSVSNNNWEPSKVQKSICNSCMTDWVPLKWLPYYQLQTSTSYLFRILYDLWPFKKCNPELIMNLHFASSLWLHCCVPASVVQCHSDLNHCWSSWVQFDLSWGDSKMSRQQKHATTIWRRVNLKHMLVPTHIYVVFSQLHQGR